MATFSFGLILIDAIVNLEFWLLRIFRLSFVVQQFEEVVYSLLLVLYSLLLVLYCAVIAPRFAGRVSISQFCTHLWA